MISVSDLRYTYPGNKSATLQGINLAIEKGEIFGLLGPSGAGKSTTVKILIGLLESYQGTVKIDNTDLKAYNRDYYQNLGIAFEFPNLYIKQTAIENLQFFASLYDKKTRSPEELLESVDLLEHKDKKVEDFSKGMKMRLNLCRALIHNPDYLFLDEPTSGLDPVSAAKVKDIIRQEQSKGKTIFLTTHNMQVVEDLCHRAAFVVDGNIAKMDTVRNLKLGEGDARVDIEFTENGAIKRKTFSLNSLAENQDFISLLKHHTVQTIHTREASMEDVFIAATGRSLT